MEAQIIHTFSKPYERFYAGIYVQIPDDLKDSRGRIVKSIHEPIGIYDDPSPAIARSICTLFERVPDLDKIVYIAPRHRKITLSRGASFDEILKLI